MQQPRDQDLVTRSLNGDRDCFALLVQRYQQPLFRHAMGMVNDGDVAADLVQDSLVRAYTRLASCNDPARFRSWLFQILRNRCHDHLRDVRQRTQEFAEDTALAPDSDDPEKALYRAELRGLVGRALATLPKAQREAFLLKHVEGFSYEELAGMLGASVSALKMRVLQAREALDLFLRAAEGSGDDQM